MGLRQPVHAEDVAAACAAALASPVAANSSYNLSGGETLSYRNMVERVFLALNFRVRLFTVPLGVFRLVLVCLRLLPRYRHWSTAMAERMNTNLVFAVVDQIDITQYGKDFLKHLVDTRQAHQRYG